VFERSAAGSGGKPPGTAAQVTPLDGTMHAWCLSVLKRSRLLLVGSKKMLIALTQSAPIPQAQIMKSPV
jgi:hypothetical protein